MPQLLEPPPAAAEEELGAYDAPEEEVAEVAEPRPAEGDRLDPIDRALHDDNGLEYADGQFIEKTVSEASSRIGGGFVADLTIAARQLEPPDAVRVYPNDLIYRCWPGEPKRSRRPDASVIRADRLAGLARDRRDLGEIPIVPDLAVEVVSPNERTEETLAKLFEYLDVGFPLIWVVYPQNRAVDVVTPEGITRLRGVDELALPDLLPAFRHNVADLVGPPPQ